MKDKPLLKLLLFPLSILYGLFIFIRNRLFDLGILPGKEFNIPVLSVGNITVGGTGKTPVTEYLAELLMNDYQIAILSRGYGRKTKGFILADNNSTPQQIGDEPCQIKELFPEIIIAVSESRVKGIQKLMTLYPGTDIILLDDAYQHRYVKPGLSILLMDYNRPVRKDFLLPAGRLREPVSEIKRANIVLITKCPADLKPIERRVIINRLELPPFQRLYFTTLEYGRITSVFPEYDVPDFIFLKEQPPEIILITGIANPKPLQKYARDISTKLTELIYPDHYEFKDKDVLKLTETFNNLLTTHKIILTTWKDAVRLKQVQTMPEEIKKVLFFVPVKVAFLNEDKNNFTKQVLNYVRDYKRSSILYKGNNKL